jgi:type II restriction/modification system DNA methylase subunit YeeA
MWIIDFGVDMPNENAALYELPYGYVSTVVMPERMRSKRAAYRQRWWIHMEARPGLRRAIKQLSRYIATPAVAKHRVFVWLEHPTLPDQQLIVIARQDDYFFGILHSRMHELWSLAMGSRLGVGNDPWYTPTSTFETFPFPWPPGEEPDRDSRIEAIAEAARRLDELRRNWVDPEGASEAELKKRTLTNLYNARPTWLENAHKVLDETVFAAYGWPLDLTDEEVLQNLLALNLERSSPRLER